MRRQTLRTAVFALSLASLSGTATFVGCGPEGPYPKQPAIDLDQEPGPSAADFSSESDLASRYDSEVLPAYLAGQAGSFSGVKGVTIQYRLFNTPGAKGTIVLLPGRTEPLLKYAETAGDLARQGYSVFLLEHRGQGESGRMLSDPQIGYVEYFHDYVDDLNTFVRTVALPSRPKHLFLVAHSMGGGIGAYYLYENPGVFEAAVLSSPMLGINTGAFPPSVASTLSGTVCNTGAGDGYALGQGAYDEHQTFTGPGNDVTRSQARFDLKIRMFAEHPELELGGVSWRWLCESTTATAELRDMGQASQTPTLMFQAGNDDIVDLGAENKYCGDASRCQMAVYPDAYHEIYQERDSIRNDALAKTVRFLNHFAAP